MSEKLSFQEIILRLINFWEERGCLVWQPHNVQVGAGTMNPATALRVLGPEPWNVVYVEPSIRPDDGRLGDNPNRMQMFYQLQLILKPDPGNPQELYLQSLEAIGIDPRRQDIRFVEDNWEAPPLSAWGLGWEVWLNGQEISQYTYFQQAGGENLDPVAVEITYGLDRIALALQGADSVWEMEYGAGVPYRDLLLRGEYEHGTYYFNVADVEALRTVYDLYEAEARRCLEAGLVLPAHDYNLKCSHLFNVMDARGAIGVAERAAYFGRMRTTFRQIAHQFMEQRQRLEFPLLDNERWVVGDGTTGDQSRATEGPATGETVDSDQPLDFVLEIGTEELPAGDLSSALAQLRALAPEMLARLRLSYESIEVHGTPRRQALIVRGLAPRQTDLEQEIKGPPAERAFDAAGQPTQAAIGFARSKGVELSALKIVGEGDRRYVAALVREEGQPAATVLAEALPGLVAGLKFDRTMRWNETNVAFSRPIRWLVSLFGEQVVPFSYAGVTSGRHSRGPRPQGSPPFAVESAAAYERMIAGAGIVIDIVQREAMIAAGARQLAVEKGGAIADDPALLAEVANLVERPTPFIGSFDRRFLALPDEVLVAVMRKHQRYFPVYGAEGRLLPHFIAVRNGDDAYIENVIEGNEHVLHARFADAEFFYKQDTRRKLADFVGDLDKLIVHARAGTMLDKTQRLELLVPAVGERLGLSAKAMAAAERAATLAKADLASKMVVEMTSLQGIMGSLYADLSGETEDVVKAIAEQYTAGILSSPGLALALADRLDSLVSLFAAKLAPQGSNDPFGLRRAALHIIDNLLANKMAFDLRDALRTAAAHQQTEVGEETVEEVMAFIRGRLEGVLAEQGHPISVVRAVLAEQTHNPYGASQAVVALTEATQAPDWPQILDAYARCVRITRDQPPHELDPARLDEPEAEALYEATEKAASRADGTVATLVASLRDLEPAITRFFDEVLVMAEDPAVRQNRLALLQRIGGLADGIADLSYLEGF